jgi:diguanylate cyclase (GGDEF)-like protein
VVIDLDGFKQVNDRFGHLEGNRVLQLAAEGFRTHCRASDFVARMGGDEFVVVLPEIGADAMAERLRLLQQAVEDAGERVCGERLVSLSAGTAFYPDHGSTGEELLELADKRMYAVKQEHHRENPGLRRLDAEAMLRHLS